MKYFDILMNPSPEEKRIQSEMDALEKAHNDSPEEKEHRRKILALASELDNERSKRLDDAENEKPQSFRLDIEKMKENGRKRVEKMKEDLGPDGRAAMEWYKNASDENKKHFDRLCRRIHYNMPEMADPVTTHEDVQELQWRLLMTAIAFIRERGLTDIYSVGFSADDLQESAKECSWSVSTDSHISVKGTENNELRLIDESY